MLLIDRAAAQRIATPSLALGAARAAFDSLANGPQPPSAEVELRVENGGVVHLKGGQRPSSAVLAIKIATGDFPSGVADGCSIVLDSREGTIVAIINDGGWLTDVRTAAVSVHAAERLMSRRGGRLSVLGTGVQAMHHLEAFRSAGMVESFTVWGRDPEKARAVAHSAGAKVASTVHEAVSDADVVVSVTSSRTPILDGAQLGAPQLVIAVGADSVGKRELSADVLESAHVIACDDLPLATSVGELQHVPHLHSRAVPLHQIPRRAGTSARAGVAVVDLCGLGLVDACIATEVIGHEPSWVHRNR